MIRYDGMALSRYLALALGFLIPISTAGTTLISLLLLGIWIGTGLVFRQLREWFQHPISLCLTLFLTIVCLSALYSPASGHDIRYALKKSFKLLLFFVCFPLFTEPKWRFRAYWALWTALTLTLILSLLEDRWFSYGWKSFGHVLEGRAVLFKDSIYHSLLIAMNGFLSALLAFHHREKSILRNSLSLFAMVAMYYLFWKATGRTGQVVYLILSLWTLSRLLGKRGMVWGMILLTTLISAASFTSPKFAARWGEVLSANRSVQVRQHLLRDSLAIVAEKPWFGWGAGSFQQVYTQYSQDPDETIYQNPHNQYLNVLVQQGVLGLLGLLAFFAVIFYSSWSLPLMESLLLQGVLFMMMIGCLGNSWLTDFTSGHLFIWLLSVCAGGLTLKDAYLERTYCIA